MLESLTIFTKGGLVLFQYTALPSVVGASDGPAHTAHQLNQQLIAKILTQPQHSGKTYHIHEQLTFLWKVEKNICIVAMYPDIMFEGPRQYLKNWCQHLVDATLREFAIFYQAAYQEAADRGAPRPDPAPFMPTFQLLLNTSKGKSAAASSNTAAASNTASNTTTNTNTTANTPASTQPQKKGKEKRNWHDGNNKVTKQAMAELDRSSADDKTDEAKEERLNQMLAEAREAYLPTDAEIKQASQDQGKVESADDSTSWSSGMTSLLQQLTGNKVLADTDLDKPLEQFEELLTSKNVARTIAQQICTATRAQLMGKRLKSLFSVQTAVRQALETVLVSILHKNRIDLSRNVSRKKGILRTNTTPYIISVMGINGIGKTTTLAKLAWYFVQKGFSPLLVAADTFRSGAVEQLKVHAQCLDVPLFSQGYSKDPSALAQAAVQHAVAQKNDVVLIDTAGRMQNNVPLMKALGKLVQENKPDLRLMVCEALVGHDGMDQFRMFERAAGGVDGLVLTKMDTVGHKVGAALTLAHQTGKPIVFCGTGQKYHHLQELSVEATVRSLLA